MKTPRAQILLVEDDTNLGYVIQDNLKMKNFAVQLYADGQTGLKAYLNNNFDICLLDVMLPKMDGFELADEIRSLNRDTPIIFLTAKSLTEDKIKGFKIGADDYITKPFDFEELLLRIEAILKRTQTGDQKEKADISKLEIGEYVFDTVNQMLIHGEENRKLTRKEADLLKLLCIHQNKILSRELTLKTIWGSDDYFSGRSMDVFISKLRKYLQDDPNIQILNVHGVGFKMLVE